MTAQTLRAFLAQWIPIESQAAHGSIQQRERIAAVAELVARQHAGDFVEIGLLHGSTTVMLAEVARRYGRRVIAIDPFEAGAQNVEANTFEIYQRTTAPYADVIKHIQVPSQDPRVIRYLRQQPIAFAFIDGLHTHDACLIDLISVGHAAVIAVDDTKDMPEVRDAVKDYFLISEPAVVSRRFIQIPEFREGWVI